MSFSSQVKNELVKIEYDTYCCKKSLLYGMALFSKVFSWRECVFQTENENIVILYKNLLSELCNINADIVVSPSGRNFSVTVSDKKSAAKLFSFLGHDKNDTSLKINFSNFVCPRCQNAFLAGAFLSCATVSSPQKDYHLEFTISYLNLTKSFVTFLQELELAPKTTTRKGYHIVYFKVSEQIEDCLYLMGASSSMFDMMNIKIVKEIRNSANRKANCETANIEKMVRAASPQIDAIRKLQNCGKFSSLPEPLRAVAQLRLENPDASLAELAEISNPPLSKSGVNHRLKRIVEIADEIEL